MRQQDTSHLDNPPFTEEQVTWLEKSRRKSVDNAIKHYSRQAIIGFFVLLIGVGYAITEARLSANHGRDAIVTSGRVVSVAGCNRDFNTIKALRGVLMSSRRFVQQGEKAGRVTHDQAARSIAFYDYQLAHRLTLPDCRRAYTLLTDDPNDLPRVPVPLFPREKTPKAHG